jgi:hypothetical protein
MSCSYEHGTAKTIRVEPTKHSEEEKLGVSFRLLIFSRGKLPDFEGGSPGDVLNQYGHISARRTERSRTLNIIA